MGINKCPHVFEAAKKNDWAFKTQEVEGRPFDQRIGGSIPDPCNQCTEVASGKIPNPKLPLKAQPLVCVYVPFGV